MTFSEQMAAAQDAEAGRAIIKAHEAAIHDLEVFHGLPPTVGENGSGFAYRGFSTVSASEWTALVKRTPDLGPLVADGLLMDAPWQRLLAAEMAAMTEPYFASDPPAQGELFK
jgi:hypothetical protein